MDPRDSQRRPAQGGESVYLFMQGLKLVLDLRAAKLTDKAEISEKSCPEVSRGPLKV